MFRPLAVAGFLLAGCAANVPRARPPEDFDPRTLAVWEFLRAKYDADGDGRVAPGEYARGEEAYFHLDADRDGAVTRDDFAREFDGQPRTADGTFVYGEGGPEVGAAAPEFTLPDLDGRPRALSEFYRERPVVLVFGSYT